MSLKETLTYEQIRRRIGILKYVFGFWVRIQFAIESIRKINRPKLGETVIYKGKEHALIQGVASPYWDLLDLSEENLSKSKRDIERRVYEKDFKMQSFHKRFKSSFMFTYNFLMRYWYDIRVDAISSKFYVKFFKN